MTNITTTNQDTAQQPPIEIWYAIKILDNPEEPEKERTFYRTTDFEICKRMLSEAQAFKTAWVDIEDKHGNPYPFEGETISV